MSERNLEIVQAAVAAYNRGDWNGALEHAAPDFELDFSRAYGLQRGVFSIEQMPRLSMYQTEAEALAATAPAGQAKG